MEPHEQLAITLPALSELVAGIEPVQLGNTTACANFDVEGIINHLLGGATAFAPAFRGSQPADHRTSGAVANAATRREVPVAEIEAALADVLDAIDAPGAMERTIDAPFGAAPGEVVARFLAFDTLIHGWDLATATGQTYDPPPNLVSAADAFARQAIGPELRDGDTFADETTPPPGAGPLERLVAFSGRTI